MADNKFLKVMQDAATDRGLTLDTGDERSDTTPAWASLKTADGSTLVEVEFISLEDAEGYRADVYEEDGGMWEPSDVATGTDTASLFRLLGTWLG